MVQIQLTAWLTLAKVPPVQVLTMPHVWLTTVEDVMPNGLWMEWRSLINAKVRETITSPALKLNYILLYIPCDFKKNDCYIHFSNSWVSNRRSGVHGVWHCLPSNLWAPQPYLHPPVCTWMPVCWRTGAGWRPMHPTRGMWWGIVITHDTGVGITRFMNATITLYFKVRLRHLNCLNPVLFLMSLAHARPVSWGTTTAQTVVSVRHSPMEDVAAMTTTSGLWRGVKKFAKVSLLLYFHCMKEWSLIQ